MSFANLSNGMMMRRRRIMEKAGFEAGIAEDSMFAGA
jgi:hypothetical protein